MGLFNKWDDRDEFNDQDPFDRFDKNLDNAINNMTPEERNRFLEGMLDGLRAMNPDLPNSSFMRDLDAEMDRMHPEFVNGMPDLPEFRSLTESSLKKLASLYITPLPPGCRSKAMQNMHKFECDTINGAKKELERRLMGDIDEDEVEMMLAEVRNIINGH